jgi:hypothetical protein
VTWDESIRVKIGGKKSRCIVPLITKNTSIEISMFYWGILKLKKISNVKRKTEAQAIYLNPLTVPMMFVFCPYVGEEKM